MTTTDVRNANAERQARFRATRTLADKKQRNADLRARRALRRELHERRRLTLTTARNTRAPLLCGASPVVEKKRPDGTVEVWEYNVASVCVQGGVPRSLPRQLPTIQQVRDHIATTNWTVPAAFPRRYSVVGSAPSGRYLAVRRG
jgi:hypothetical protein